MKNLKNFALVISCAIMLILVSCFSFTGIKGNGKVVSEVRKVAEFSKIKASRGVDVVLIQSVSQSVRVSCDENVIQYLTTKVKNGTLEITFTENVRLLKAKRVYVSFVRMNDISASSGSKVKSKATLKLKELNVSASSGAHVNLLVETLNCKLSASSGSHIFMKGSTQTLSTKVNSGSNIDGKELIAVKCDASASSGSTCSVYASENIVAKASSGGSISYYGQPKGIDINKSSGGSVTGK